MTLLKAAGLKYMILKWRHMLGEISNLTHRHHSLQIFRLAASSVHIGRLFKNTLQLSQLTVSVQMTHANELILHKEEDSCHIKKYKFIPTKNAINFYLGHFEN